MPGKGTKRFVDGEIPDFVYHYTGYAGLEGILESGKIWGVYSGMMNDINETSGGFSALIKYAEEQRALMRGETGERPVSESAAVTLFSELHKSKSYDNLFVTCFSSRRDALSLWRGYGPDAGYAIQFRTEKLRQVAPATDPASDRQGGTCLLKVAYNENDYMASIRKLAKENAGQNDEFRAHDFFRLTAGHKDEAWEDEQEWRLVTLHHTECQNSDRAPKMKFHQGAFGFTPHLELDLWGKERKEIPDWIKSIWVGPGSYQGARIDGLKKYLRQLGLNPGGPPGPSVEPSEVPLRATR